MLKVNGGGINFDNVYFFYLGVDNKFIDVFINLDLSIKFGEKVGLVGCFGVGKLILVNLFMCFYDI